MNIIVIMSDTFRVDNLTCYSRESMVKTPNLDKLSSQSFVFDRCYCASFPTVPNRFDIFTGTHSFVKQDWSPLPFNEIVLSQILTEGGYNTALIADTPHIIQHGFNYERGFTTYLWNRGQENDRLYSFPDAVELPCSVKKLRDPANNLIPHMRNIYYNRYEEDCFAPRTMSDACRWLEKNHDKGEFFLWIDTFDPHEPWDPPEYYIDMYDPYYLGERVIYPQYHPVTFFTEEEISHCRSMYNGEVTMVDRWIGRVLEQVEYLGIQGETTIIFTSDHGFLFGEHGFIGKTFIADDYFECLRLYEEIVHVPLMIRLPGQKEQKRIPGLVSSTDLMPTILEMLNLTDTAERGGMTQAQTLQCGFTQPQSWSLDVGSLHGKSFCSLLNGKEKKIHEYVISSFPLMHGTPRIDKSVITTEEWSLHVAGKAADPESELLPPPGLTYRNNPGDYQPGTTKAALFHTPEDPGQTCDVISDNLSLARDLHGEYVKSLEAWDLDKKRLDLNKKLNL
ncbi:MAG: hypothetical protein AMS17_15740 [Spirochaetes bacterium DG_61]|nr:MAG: hypothetical protein AMS17_15740 [Spirochaetes bacterium DG_61]